MQKSKLNIQAGLMLIMVCFTGRTAVAQAARRQQYKDTAVINSIYRQNGGAELWSSADAEHMLNALRRIADSAAWYGLEPEKYKFGHNGIAADKAGKRYETDSANTATAVRLARDFWSGTGIERYISNDEVSRSFARSSDSFILGWFLGLPAHTSVQRHLSALDPGDNTYRTLKEALRRKIDSGRANRQSELVASINIHRWISHFRFDRYIVVNIPSATLRYFEAGTKRLEMKVIVGKPSTRTPRFSSWCTKVILYPYWNVPRSIAIKELLPIFRKSPSALAAMNMQVIGKNGHIADPHALDWRSFNRNYFPYTIRQCTGCDNALGVIKFTLTDPFDVYMHDTNNKPAFESDHRYYSHGCIRLSKPLELGNYLLNNRLDSGFLKACLRGQDPVSIDLDKPVPVFVVYMTAEATGDSVVYHRDVYHLYKK